LLAKEKKRVGRSYHTVWEKNLDPFLNGAAEPTRQKTTHRFGGVSPSFTITDSAPRGNRVYLKAPRLKKQPEKKKG